LPVRHAKRTGIRRMQPSNVRQEIQLRLTLSSSG
jgi:hypothetical protein